MGDRWESRSYYVHPDRFQIWDSDARLDHERELRRDHKARHSRSRSPSTERERDYRRRSLKEEEYRARQRVEESKKVENQLPVGESRSRSDQGQTKRHQEHPEGVQRTYPLEELSAVELKEKRRLRDQEARERARKTREEERFVESIRSRLKSNPESLSNADLVKIPLRDISNISKSAGKTLLPRRVIRTYLRWLEAQRNAPLNNHNMSWRTTVTNWTLSLHSQGFLFKEVEADFQSWRATCGPFRDVCVKLVAPPIIEVRAPPTHAALREPYLNPSFGKSVQSEGSFLPGKEVEMADKSVSDKYAREPEGRQRDEPHLSSAYICIRCNNTGHLLDNCPTNMDPRYDVFPPRDYVCKYCGGAATHYSTLCHLNPDPNCLYQLRQGNVALKKENDDRASLKQKFKENDSPAFSGTPSIARKEIIAPKQPKSAKSKTVAVKAIRAGDSVIGLCVMNVDSGIAAMGLLDKIDRTKVSLVEPNGHSFVLHFQTVVERDSALSRLPSMVKKRAYPEDRSRPLVEVFKVVKSNANSNQPLGQRDSGWKSLPIRSSQPPSQDIQETTDSKPVSTQRSEEYGRLGYERFSTPEDFSDEVQSISEMNDDFTEQKNEVAGQVKATKTENGYTRQEILERRRIIAEEVDLLIAEYSSQYPEEGAKKVNTMGRLMAGVSENKSTTGESSPGSDDFQDAMEWKPNEDKPQMGTANKLKVLSPLEYGDAVLKLFKTRFNPVVNTPARRPTALEMWDQQDEKKLKELRAAEINTDLASPGKDYECVYDDGKSVSSLNTGIEVGTETSEQSSNQLTNSTKASVREFILTPPSREIPGSTNTVRSTTSIFYYTSRTRSNARAIIKKSPCKDPLGKLERKLQYEAQKFALLEGNPVRHPCSKLRRFMIRKAKREELERDSREAAEQGAE